MLHITNGDSAAGSLRQAGLPGTVAVWADVLHDGPVPAGVEGDAWRELRARFAADAGLCPYEDAKAMCEQWDRDLASYRDHDEVVLWFEHDLFDQLLLIRHLDWFARQPEPPRRLSLICIDRFPGVEPFHGLGQLKPHQMASLFGTQQAVTREAIRLAVRAWHAFRSSDPRDLEALVESEDTSALPFLAGALRRQLEEYPEVGSGLSRTERQILEAVRDGAGSPAEAFVRTKAMEDRVFMGDSSFWTRVRHLASGAAPLLDLDGDTVTPTRLARAATKLTDTGDAVLSGRADWVGIRGVDRWIGGVHLTGKDAAWRWNRRTHRLQHGG
jgi:hypothetical protein